MILDVEKILKIKKEKKLTWEKIAAHWKISRQAACQRLYSKNIKNSILFGEIFNVHPKSIIKIFPGEDFDVIFERSTKPKMIYFVQMGKNGPIKIGKTANIKERLKVFQASSPYKIKLLYYKKCFKPPLEYELHKKFKAERIHGEWFHPSKKIFNYIEQLKMLR